MFFARPFRVGYGNGNLGPPGPSQQSRQPEPQPEQPEQPQQPYGWHARDDRDDRESSAEAQEGLWDVAEREELQPAWERGRAGAAASRLSPEGGDPQRAFARPRNGRGRGRGRPRDGRAARASRPSLEAPEEEGGEGGGRGDGEDDDADEDGEDGPEEGGDMQEAAARVSTCGEAMEYCTLLLRRQVERAAQADAGANAAIQGDGFARRSAITLLTTQQMRQLFLRLVQDRNNWQRLRPLFGAPPYHFLASEDAGLIRAAGLGLGRVNMAYEQASAANYNQFGIPHLLDQHGREYRALHSDSQTRTQESAESADRPVPYAPSALRSAQRVQFFCRLKKKRRAHRGKLLRDPARRAALSFPGVNEVLVLSYSPELARVWPPAAEANGGGPELSGQESERVAEQRVCVKHVLPRGARAATAIVVASRM